MKRLPDWPTRMHDFVLERFNRPFEWGTNDCAIFVADYVKAVTGVDPIDPSWREHSTALQAARFIEDNGGLKNIGTLAFGEPIHPSMASVGDVVLVDDDGRVSMGVCNGTTALATGESGLVSVSMTLAQVAWRI